MLDGLQAEGEAAVLVHWTLSRGHPRAQAREGRGGGRQAAADGLARRTGLGREGAPLRARACRCLTDHAVAHLLEAAQVCDGLVKGLRHPDWPADPWDGLKRLVLMLVQQTASVAPSAKPRPVVVQRLALQG